MQPRTQKQTEPMYMSTGIDVYMMGATAVRTGTGFKKRLISDALRCHSLVGISARANDSSVLQHDARGTRLQWLNG